MTDRQSIVNTRRSLMIFANRHGIQQACRSFGVSRTTFYKIKEQFIRTGSLEPKRRSKPKMPNETSLYKKKLLLKLVQEHPTWGPRKYAHELRNHGLAVTGIGVWYCLKRFGLNQRFKRLVYLESLKAKEQPLTERTLRKTQRACRKIAQGLWPGHIVAIDTFFVGHLKGVGRIYQMTGIDLCSRFGWANLYLSKEQDSAVDFLESYLIPKFFYNNISLENVLSDNGTEFTGNRFQNMLKDYDIKHKRIKPGQPILNAFCERFQRTIFEEFYQTAFRKKIYSNLQELNKELQDYLVFYNFNRAHFGLHPNGLIPSEVLKSRSSALRHRFQELLT